MGRVSVLVVYEEELRGIQTSFLYPRSYKILDKIP